MAKTTITGLSAAERRRLRRLATADGAKSYGDWLKEEAPKSGGDAALLAAEKAADRTAVGYGRAGETLTAKGLADDGYASYLRLAAKEARETRRQELLKGSAEEGAELLRGYADYLRGERDAEGERLITAAERLAKGEYERDAAEEYIASVGARGEAAELLRSLRREPVKEPELSPAEAINYIVRHQLPSVHAMEYCLLIGYDEETASTLVKQAELRRSENTDRLLGMLGY